MSLPLPSPFTFTISYCGLYLALGPYIYHTMILEFVFDSLRVSSTENVLLHFAFTSHLKHISTF